MKKLERSIKQLEQEIMQNKQAIYLQYEYTKAQLINKFVSPSSFLVAFTAGGLLSKPIKRQLKKRSKQLTTSQPKLSLMQRLITLSSEISVAVKLFHRLKQMSMRLSQKTHNNAITP